MGFFKKKAVKKIDGRAWGHLVSVHNIDVDTLSNEVRCMDREGVLDGGESVTFLRVFKPPEAEKREIVVTGWETFDQHPELIIFEGYLTKTNTAHLERKRVQGLVSLARIETRSSISLDHINFVEGRKVWRQQPKRKRKLLLRRNKRESENGWIVLMTLWRAGDLYFA